MHYYIGIDGGGTKTAVRLSDENGNTLSDIRVGRSNHADTSMEASLSLIENSIRTVVENARLTPDAITAVYAGIAGSTCDNYQQLCRERILNVTVNAKVKVDNDASVLFVRLDNGDGAVLICGTGSICFTQKNGVRRRIGGYGELDMLGSGCDIGKMALAYTLRVIDGREKSGLLDKLIYEKNGASTLEIEADLVRGGKPVYASFAPLVFEAYRGKDEAAVRILNDNFDFLTGYFINASQDLGNSFTAVISGGVMRDPIAQALLKEKTKAAKLDISFIPAPDGAACAVDCARQL
ncbi:MAG TPA: ROK family protein [Bacillota bacterium]|nr:ROK family protein [Bacillota bacterium]